MTVKRKKLMQIWQHCGNGRAAEGWVDTRRLRLMQRYRLPRSKISRVNLDTWRERCRSRPLRRRKRKPFPRRTSPIPDRRYAYLSWNPTSRDVTRCFWPRRDKGLSVGGWKFHRRQQVGHATFVISYYLLQSVSPTCEPRRRNLFLDDRNHCVTSATRLCVLLRAAYKF